MTPPSHQGLWHTGAVPAVALLAVGSGTPSFGDRIREAREARGWTVAACARRFVALRAEAGERLDVANIRSQWSKWEHGVHRPDRLSQRLIAQVFGVPVEAVFGLTNESNLPRPILVEAHVTPETIGLLRRQRGVHAEAEHSLGPQFAKALVGTDLVTIEALVRLTPEALSPQVHAVAASVAELGGWIAQECGDRAKALELTLRAFEYAEESGDSSLEAMILMRRSNLVAPVDPRRGAELADRAAELVQRSEPSRLHATIARQRAQAAAFLDDRSAFERYSSQAGEYAQADPQHDELTPYAHPGYIASETAAGLIMLGEAQAAATLLAEHGLTPVPGQERDHAVALARWLQALVGSGDHLVGRLPGSA